MSSDLERLAKEFKRSRQPDIADGTIALAKLARKVHAPETFNLPFDIPAVSEKLYLHAREVLAREGLRFVVAINPVSIDRLVIDEGTESSLGYIHPSEEMRSSVPPQIEIAINPKQFRIENSNSLSTDGQFERIKEQEAILKGKLPRNVRSIISMLRPRHASILVQLDLTYQKKENEVLFTDWFGRADDQTVPGSNARVGRTAATRKLEIIDWFRDNGHGGTFAVSAVILPRRRLLV